MFEVGDVVTYKEHTGKVIFACEFSISILIGDELPKATQTRIVVYSHSWAAVKLATDSSEGVHYSNTGDQNRVLLSQVKQIA